MNVLFIADIYGSPGRKAVRDLMPEIVSSMGIDFVVANVENAAAGFGVTKDILVELKGLGVECMTSGNHIWDRRESLPLLTEEPLLLRPHNYPPGVPGSGSRMFTTKAGVKVGVLNLMGRVFMRELEDPFRVADREVAVLREEANVVIVDFHAEVTAVLLAGAPIAAEIRAQVRVRFDRLESQGITPGLAIVTVGEPPGGNPYVRSKVAAAEELGARATITRLPADSSEDQVRARLK